MIHTKRSMKEGIKAEQQEDLEIFVFLKTIIISMCVWVVEEVFQKSHANFNTSIKIYLIKIDQPIHYSIKKTPNFMTLFARSTTFYNKGSPIKVIPFTAISESDNR